MRRYDPFARFYNFVSLFLFFETRVRKRAVALLGERPGGRVLDLGCGTGFHFPDLARIVGATGEVIGIDPSAPSLTVATKRAHRHRMRFTSVVGDGAELAVEGELDGVIAAFSMSVISDWTTAIARAASHLSPGSRIVILEQDLSEAPRLALLKPLFIFVNRLLGASLDREYARELEKHQLAVTVERFGAYAIFVGEKL